MSSAERKTSEWDMSWRAVYVLAEVLFLCLLILINTKKTLSSWHKQSDTPVYTLILYMY